MGRLSLGSTNQSLDNLKVKSPLHAWIIKVRFFFQAISIKLIIASLSVSKIYQKKMLILSIISTLLSNAVNIRRDVAILYNRIAIIILIYCIFNDITSLTVVTKGIGLHGGLLLINNITQIFHIFVYLISALILTLTSFYPRKV